MLNNQTQIVKKFHINALPIILIALIFNNAKIMKRNNNAHVINFIIKIENIANSGAKSCKWLQG